MKKLYLLWSVAVLMMACSELTDVKNNIPTVTTGEATDVTAHSANISIVGTDYDYYFLELSTSSAFTVGNTRRVTGASTPKWAATGLLAGTTYYYRQCATDGLTTINGPIRQFETPAIVTIADILLVPWNEKTASQPVTDRAIGLYFSSAATMSDYTGMANIQPRYNETTNFWELSKDMAPPVDTYRFYAYAPYMTSITNKQVVPVDVTKTNTDYLYGQSGDITPTQPNATITMRHALAHVVFDVKKDKTNNTDFVIRRYGLYTKKYDGVTGLSNSGTLDITTGNIKVNYFGESIGRTIESQTLTTTTLPLVFYVIPFSFDNGDLQLELFGSSTSYDSYKSVSVPASKWLAGMEYHYEVTVKQNTLEIGDVEVRPWTEQTGDDIIINN